MSKLVWDEVGKRTYETGLDHGVLYLQNGTAVPWNGLTSIIEAFDRDNNPVYYDGMKINDFVSLGSFSATMAAVTYPDEFIELEGLSGPRHGVFYADQPPKAFGLCYRTQVGNDLEGGASGYKIHILYNVTAVPSQKTYASLTTEPSLVEFEWQISAVPEEVVGYFPTAHIILDTRKVDPVLMAELEAILYGTSQAEASLIPMVQIVDLINNFFRVEIVDNGDGTWQAISEIDGVVTVDSEELFTVIFVNAVYLDNETYQVQSTKGMAEVPQIKIYDVGNGTWTATSDYDALIVTVEPGMVDILNATTSPIDANTYEISDTPAEE